MALRSAFFARPSQKDAPSRPSLTLFFLLAGAFLLTLVPHVGQFPLWLSVTIVGAIGLRAVIEAYRLPLPSSAFCGIIAIILLGAIYFQFRTVMGRDAGTAFTAGLLAIKFYELRRLRDVALIIFSCFFVVMSALLYSQVLELFVYCLIMMWVLTALLLRVHTGDLPEDRLLRMLRRSGVIFLQALPLALFLFLFCPRYTGRLGIPLDQTSIGLSDTVKPGSIASLAQNDEEAMYVQFESGSVPPPSLMYWRALVLWDYQNGVWTQGPLSGVAPITPPKAAPGNEPIIQEITIWPHRERWLFALDSPITAATNTSEPAPWSAMLNGNVVQLIAGRLDHKTRYTVYSADTLAEEEPNPLEQKYGVELDGIDPRVRQLADSLHAGVGPGQESVYIHNVLRYFRQNKFVYTADPGPMGKNWLPVFLFTAKAGFCEHYASAFAVMMRLEKIPARLVAGYQGAEYNPYADRYSVLQSNAHAWDEVWIASKKRWVRYDPTALLALGDEDSARSTTDPGNLAIRVDQRQKSLYETYVPQLLRNGIEEVQLRRDQVETQWDNLVFSYDQEAQSRLAHALGFGQQPDAALVVGCLTFASVFMFAFRAWMTRRRALSPVESLYATFCRAMARRGVPRASWEGPLAYTNRVAEAFPSEQFAIHRVGTIVAEVRYGRDGEIETAPTDLRALLIRITASQAAASSRDRAS